MELRELTKALAAMIRRVSDDDQATIFDAIVQLRRREMEILKHDEENPTL